MPDDYFDHIPKYAAGSDMDSIRTGKPVRGGSNGNGTKFTITLALIALAVMLGIYKSESKEINPQLVMPTLPPPKQTMQVKEPIPQPEMELTEFFYSADLTKATVKMVMRNPSNKTITDIVITYTIKDAEGNEVARTTKERKDTILPNGEIEDTEVIGLPGIPNKMLTASANVNYKYRG